MRWENRWFGELENLPQASRKKKKKICQYCGNDLLSSCKVFLFIMSDSKLGQIAFIDAASSLPPPFHLPWCHSVGEKIMLLLHLLLLSFSFYSNPGPRTTRPSCHFLGLCENASSFSKQKKTSAHLRFVAFTDPQITYPEMKTQKAATTSKKCHQHIILYAATPAVGWSEAAPRCGTLSSSCRLEPRRVFSPDETL